MWLASSVILVSLIAFAVISFFVSRRIRLTEYTSYRDRASFRQILFSVLASLVGGWMFFGLSAVGYEAGIVGYVMGCGYAVGLILIGYFIPRIKKAMSSANCDTMDEVIGIRYGKTAQAATSFINLSFFLAVLAAQFIAMTAFLNLFLQAQSDILFYAALAVVLLYTILAGFKGVLFTDAWQFWVVSVTIVFVFFTLTFNVDWQTVKTLPSVYFNATGYGMSFLVGVLIFLPLSLLVRSDLWQRIASAKTERHVQKAFYVSAPILFVFYFLLTNIGIYARATLGEGAAAETSGLILFLNIMRDPVTGEFSVVASLLLAFLSLGVFAALLSTIDTNLNVVSVAISKLIRRSQWAKFESETPDKTSGPRTGLENSLLTTTRVITLVLGVLGLVVARMIPDIVDLIVGAAAILLVFIPAVMATLFWKSRRVVAANVSIITGYVTFLVLAFSLANPKVAFLPGVVVSFLSFLVIRFLQRKPTKHA